MIATRQLVMEGVWVVGQQSAYIANTLQLRDVAMATIFVFLYMGWRVHWRHLANTTEPSVCGCDAALCQITLSTCFLQITAVFFAVFWLWSLLVFVFVCVCVCDVQHVFVLVWPWACVVWAAKVWLVSFCYLDFEQVVEINFSLLTWNSCFARSLVGSVTQPPSKRIGVKTHIWGSSAFLWADMDPICCKTCHL